MAVAHDLGGHHSAPVFFILPAQHGLERVLVVFKGDVGDKAKPTLVDAHHGHAKLGQLAADAQHGAVAAHDQRQVALSADSGCIKGRKLAQAGIAGRVFLKCDLATLSAQKVRDVLQCGTRALGVVFADQGDMAELRLHRQITSQHSWQAS